MDSAENEFGMFYVCKTSSKSLEMTILVGFDYPSI